MFVGSDTGTITSWRLAPGPLAVEPTRPGLDRVVALGSGGDFVVGADQDGRVISWGLTGRRSPAGAPLAQAAGPLQAVARNADGAVASGGADGVVRVTRNGSTVDTPTFEGSVAGLAWRPTGAIVVGTDRGTLYELDPATGTITTLSERPGTAVTATKGSVSAIALSADGNKVAVASGVADKGERFRDVLTFTGHALPVTSIAFSPDGLTLASGSDDRAIRLWTVADGSTKSTLQGHTDMVLALAYSPDGTTLASGSQDGTLRLWDVGSGLQIGRPLESGSGYVWSLAPSPDGANLVAANGTAVVEWPFGKGAWLDRACRLARRLLTDDERNRYLPGTSLLPCA
ncbi:WD40 repeat domain-containing protein [Amycolatopsis orientalis]|uniref:WD40 repeat domain-containing protein n=1 Tax=Amycolatopsis orientalis TaxID=31958 RepID=UPI0003FE6783|nr:hypothetical protein [Amycolatopsis orientalis]